MHFFPSVVIAVTFRLVLDLLIYQERIYSLVLGTWEGVCLAHFVQVDGHSLRPYIALALRISLDILRKMDYKLPMLTLIWAALTACIAVALGPGHGYDTLRERSTPSRRGPIRPEWADSGRTSNSPSYHYYLSHAARNKNQVSSSPSTSPEPNHSRRAVLSSSAATADNNAGTETQSLSDFQQDISGMTSRMADPRKFASTSGSRGHLSIVPTYTNESDSSSTKTIPLPQPIAIQHQLVHGLLDEDFTADNLEVLPRPVMLAGAFSAHHGSLRVEDELLTSTPNSIAVYRSDDELQTPSYIAPLSPSGVARNDPVAGKQPLPTLILHGGRVRDRTENYPDREPGCVPGPSLLKEGSVEGIHDAELLFEVSQPAATSILQPHATSEIGRKTERESGPEDVMLSPVATDISLDLDLDAQTIRCKAEKHRQDAWSLKKQIERLRQEIKRSKDVKQKFLMECELKQVELEEKKLHGRAQRNFFRGAL